MKKKMKKPIPHEVEVACKSVLYLGLHGIVLTASFSKTAPPPQDVAEFLQPYLDEIAAQSEGTIQFILAMIEDDLVAKGYPLAKYPS